MKKIILCLFEKKKFADFPTLKFDCLLITSIPYYPLVHWIFSIE